LHGFCAQAEQGLAAAQGLLPADHAGTAMAMAAAAAPAARVAFRVFLS
jgi:hypothetical protein